jgi:hypothetical protein
MDVRKRFGVTMKDGKTRLVRGWIFSDIFGCCLTTDGISLTHLPTGRTLGFFKNRKVARDVAAYVEKHSGAGISSWKVKTSLKAIPKAVRAWVRERRAHVRVG